MRKILTVARREYLAAVRTKAFLISTLLMPLLMFGGVAMQRATQKMVDAETYRIAVVDRTQGGSLAKALVQAAERRNNVDRINKSTGKPTGPAFAIEVVEPAPGSDRAAIDRQRLELSDRTRSKQLLAFVEIGPKVSEADVAGLLKTSLSAATQMSPDATPEEMQGNLFAMLNDLPDDAIVRYSTSQPTLLVFRSWLSQALAQPVAQQRILQLGIDAVKIPKIVSAILPPPVVDRGMARRDADGSITYDAKNANVIVNTLVPTVLLALMFIAVMTGASPLATNIIEEKQLRIAEILLGGLRPFELMLGKLLGGAATSVTLAAIYFAGMFYAANRMGFSQYISGETTAWFLLFTLIGVMMYGSLFVAAGAAVTNLKEAQTTLTPVMLVVAAPFFVMMNVVQYPNGMLAKVMTFFPITAPSVAIIRAAIPNGAARWELALSAVCSIVGMLIIIWIAGRIFRAGMLLTSKPASIKEAIGWILRG